VRVICQRVKEAKVEVDQKVIGQIEKGYLLYIGFTHEDNEETLLKMARKIERLRIFEDDNQRLNLNLSQVQGSILAVSQFTLYGDVTNNHRPSFMAAAKPDVAHKLYEQFIALLKTFSYVETGQFGADMKVFSINDGPVTIEIEY